MKMKKTIGELEQLLAAGLEDAKFLNVFDQARLTEYSKIVTGGAGLLNGNGCVGKYVSLKAYMKVRIAIVIKPASGTNTSTVSVKQATNVENSPVTEKTLPFTNVYWNSDVTVSDRLVATPVVSNQFLTSNAAKWEMFVIEIDQTDLDINNNFDAIRVDMTDPGSGVSTPFAVIYDCYPAKFAGPVDRTPSAITD